MDQTFYNEYRCVGGLFEDQQDMFDEFYCTLGLLQVFDRLGLMKVQEDHRGRPHSEMVIKIDDVIYKEHIIFWNRRFE